MTAIQKGLQSSSCMGVDVMGPVMMRAAWFCTLLILSILVLAVVPHAAMPYSRAGVTLPVYSLFRVEASGPHIVLSSFFMSASWTFALD